MIAKRLKKLIPCYDVREDIFDLILADYSPAVVKVDSLKDYVYGYQNKNTFYYENNGGIEHLICPEYVLNYYTNSILGCTSWKQCKIRRTENTKITCTKTITGSYAWNYIHKLLTKYYSEEEFISILNSHSVDEAHKDKQRHFFHLGYKHKVIRFKNAYKYDINGAHTDALLEMFPKAKKDIMSLYQKGKEVDSDGNKLHPECKQFFNFFVGELCNKGFRGTYNWVVKRTCTIFDNGIDSTGGLSIYENTDGFAVYGLKNKLEPSKELGKFKLEHYGDIYVYVSDNYWLMQCGSELTGSCRCVVRDDIDLSKGIVVDYKQNRKELTEINKHKVEILDYEE